MFQSRRERKCNVHSAESSSILEALVTTNLLVKSDGLNNVECYMRPTTIRLTMWLFPISMKLRKVRLLHSGSLLHTAYLPDPKPRESVERLIITEEPGSDGEHRGGDGALL